jgi:hypothetical protein
MIGPYKTEREFVTAVSDMARRVWKSTEEFGSSVVIRESYAIDDRCVQIVCGVEEIEEQ